MKNANIQKPIGLYELCSAVEEICQNAEIYKRIKPPHMIVELDAGCGRTTCAQYIADMYREHDVLPFTSGLDDYLEVVLDGSSPQKIKDSFAVFSAAAVYENAYDGIALLDISDMANYLNGTQLNEFLSRIVTLCDTAVCIFFVRSSPSPREEQLISKLLTRIEQVKRIYYKALCAEDACRLLEQTMKEYGVFIEHHQVFACKLVQVVEERNIDNAKDVQVFAKTLVHYADYSQHPPLVDEKSLAKLPAAKYQIEKGSNKI